MQNEVISHFFARANSECGLPELGEVELAHATFGPMLVFAADQVIGHSIRVQGGFQEAKIDEVVAFLSQRHQFVPSTFVDIGANIGTHLLYALKKSGFSRGIGIEPDVRNFSLLLCNTVLNSVAANVELLNCALSDGAGRAELELSPTNYGDHRVRNMAVAQTMSFGEVDRQTCTVSTETLSSVLERFGVQSEGTLLWMDTQGHEGQILRSIGRGAHLPAGTRYLVMEFWPYGLHRADGKVPYFDFLEGCKAIHDINATNWKDSPVTCAHLESTYDLMLAQTSAEHYPHTDLLCIM
jgi:FkbM family methyltransferase